METENNIYVLYKYQEHLDTIKEDFDIYCNDRRKIVYFMFLDEKHFLLVRNIDEGIPDDQKHLSNPYWYKPVREFDSEIVEDINGIHPPSEFEMLVVSSYMENVSDLINVTKTNKNYKTLLSQFKKNPFDLENEKDLQYFENLETLKYYGEDDILFKSPTKEQIHYVVRFLLYMDKLYDYSDLPDK